MKRVSKKLLVLATGIGLIAGNFSATQSSAATVPNQLSQKSIEAQTTLQQQDEKYISDQTLLIKYAKPLKASEHRKAGGTVD